MTSPRAHAFVSVGLAAAAIAIAATLAARGELRDPRRLEPGMPAPEELASLVDAGQAGLSHLILFSTNCSWCTRQADALRAAGRPRTPVHVVVLQETPGDNARVPGLPAWVQVSYISRSDLERKVGGLATPTHVWLDRAGRIVFSARGFKPADMLRRMDAMEMTSQ